MSYLLQKLPGESIIVFTANPDFDLGTELPNTVVDFLGLLERETAPITYILDLCALPPISMDDIMLTASTLTRGENPVYHHPKIHKIMAVTPNEAYQMAYKGLAGEMFGHLDVDVFDTLPEALAVARRK
jgi:hypothetical protein